MPENYNDMVAALTSRRQHFAGDDVLQRLRELREAREREEREPVFRDDPEPVSQFMPPPETEQALYDASVTPGYGMNLLQGASIPLSAFPIAGDLAGLAGDIQMYKEDPESRKWMNYLLTAAGALPIVPSLAYLMNRGGNAAPNAMRSPGNNQAGAIGYQGSPHRFDALDPSKIGTGEGAQAYGHGAYVAESRDVAQTYQPRDFDAEEIMMARYKEAESAGDYNRMEQWESAMMHDTPDDLRKRSMDMDYDEDYRQAAAEVAEELADIPSASYLYEIDVPDEDIAKMLDWDKPLSEQPESVRKALENTPAAQRLNKMDADAREAFGDTYTDDWVTEVSAGSLYREMADELGAAGASKAMQDAGIPGIKYFDQGSRAAGEGTRNMVLFDDLARRAKILKRNDETIAQPSVDEFIGKLLED
jgi:hypothetical protein